MGLLERRSLTSALGRKQTDRKEWKAVATTGKVYCLCKAHAVGRFCPTTDEKGKFRCLDREQLSSKN